MHSLKILTSLSAQEIKERKDEDLLVLPTDAVLFDDPSFKVNKWTLFPFHQSAVGSL